MNQKPIKRPIESKVITLATRPVAHQNATINDIIKKKLAILDANVLKPQNTNRPPNRHEEMYPKGNESAG